MTKRVLLTGGGGFLGSHVLIHLLKNTDWDIVVVDGFQAAQKGRIDRIQDQIKHFGASEMWDRLNIRTHDLRTPMPADLGPIDYVLSVASESHVPRSIEAPLPFVVNNVELMLNLLEWARANEPEEFIHISTSEVYGPAPADYDFREGDEHFPTNPYAASKAAQEDLCRAWAKTYGLNIGLVNAMNLFGEMQDPEKFIPLVTKKVLAGETVRIHAPGGKPGSRTHNHARNQADALLFLLDKWGAVDGEQFHVTGDREVDNLELAQMIADAVGRELVYELAEPDRLGHDARYALDASEIARCGWKAPIGFEESLERTVAWTVEHPEWLKAL